MREIPSDSPATTVANSTEGSTPSLTAPCNLGHSDKTPTSLRFWAKVEKNGPLSCWPWTAYRDKDGYGRFSVGGIQNFAHRVAFVLAGNSLSPLQNVCHSCDNPACVNPAHLFIGTQADNLRDRDAKGHTARGERNGRAKLTESQVGEIRDWRKVGASYRSIASRFGINDKTVRQICSGKLWRGE